MRGTIGFVGPGDGRIHVKRHRHGANAAVGRHIALSFPARAEPEVAGAGVGDLGRRAEGDLCPGLIPVLPLGRCRG